MRSMDEIIVTQQADIKEMILTIRGMQVLLDSDVAMLYGYETKQINQAANRNKDRFPASFRFQLTSAEIDGILFSRCQNGTLNDEQSLSDSMRCHSGTAYISDSMRSQNVTAEVQDGSRSQNVTLNRGQNIKYLPYAYTEQGIFYKGRNPNTKIG